MSRHHLIITTCLLGLFVQCTESPPAPLLSTEDLQKEIIAMERAFADRVAEKGMAEAFLHFAADDAVLQRGNGVVEGKQAIAAWFAQQPARQNVSLTWTPDHVSVSAAGDMAYTYGKYTYQARDTLGEVISSDGIFHTIWQRQGDGTWKYVWD